MVGALFRYSARHPRPESLSREQLVAAGGGGNGAHPVEELPIRILHSVPLLPPAQLDPLRYSYMYIISDEPTVMYTYIYCGSTCSTSPVGVHLIQIPNRRCARSVRERVEARAEERPDRQVRRESDTQLHRRRTSALPSALHHRSELEAGPQDPVARWSGTNARTSQAEAFCCFLQRSIHHFRSH